MLIFWFELEISGMAVQSREYIKTAKNGSFCEELLIENDFETVVTNLCCQRF